MTTTSTAVSRRDLAILRAVASGRCWVSRPGSALIVDGRCCSDQFAGLRLRAAGWIRPAAPPRLTDLGSTAAELTPAGLALLEAA